MKNKIKNGYFFQYQDKVYIRVGSRCYRLPLKQTDVFLYTMFKDILESNIRAVFKPNGERVE